MAIPKTQDYFTRDEYLTMEEVAEYRSEYFRGEIFAMAGATANHDRISNACNRLIGNALDGGSCEYFSNDIKVRIPNDDIYYYPELSAVCGPAEFEDEKETILTNPFVIIEVLSDGTESFDRGKKFHRYKQIPSLKEYILIAQDELQIDVFQNADDGIWHLRSYSGVEDSLEINSLNIRLPLAEIYRRVKFRSKP
jgi:Uma2 family endonuclease